MSAIATFSFPTTVKFGDGARHAIAASLRARGAARPLLVTDANVAALPIFEDVRASLTDALGDGVAAFHDFAGNPVESHVTAGVEAFHAHGADAIVAFGGGAALDVARAIALMAHHPGALFDYEDGKPDARPVDQPIPTLFAVPTTAGTGSEVGRSTVISDDATHAKKIMFSPRLMAVEVFADPELTVDLPPGPTAATGMDALTHCIEAFLARGWHPMCDAIALEGVHLAAGALVRAVTDGRDLRARRDMMMASMMGAVAFQKGLGATHSLAHALSTVKDLHHGLANGIMLPYVMNFNAEVVPERLQRLAHAAGAPSGTPDGFIEWLTKLKQRVGIPQLLSRVGVAESDLDALADVAIADACHPSNPRTCTRDDLRRLYSHAL